MFIIVGDLERRFYCDVSCWAQSDTVFDTERRVCGGRGGRRDVNRDDALGGVCLGVVVFHPSIFKWGATWEGGQVGGG